MTTTYGYRMFSIQLPLWTVVTIVLVMILLVIILSGRRK